MCVLGKDDEFFPPAMAFEQVTVPERASILLLGHCGHLAPVEHPAETAVAMLELARRGSSPS